LFDLTELIKFTADRTYYLLAAPIILKISINSLMMSIYKLIAAMT